MDNSAISWFSELGMESPFLSDQCHNMDFFDEDLSAAFGDDFQSSLSPEGNSPSCIPTIIPRSSSPTSLCASSFREPPATITDRPAKQHRPNGYNSSNIHKRSAFDQATASPIILTFGNPDTLEINPQQVSPGSLYPEDDEWSEVLTSHGSFVNLVEATKTTVQTKAKKKPGGRPPSKTYDHVTAERKRREQLSQQFMALSAIVPGLKKMDKTSILGDAIEYLKHLQERVKTLEEQATKQTMESVVLVKKSQLPVEDEGSSDEMCSTDNQWALPEIEAKICDKKVLLRVHCENQRGLLIKILSEVQKLNLVVTNTSASKFGSLALDITIIAEMGKEFNLTTKELAKILQSALQLVTQEA